MLKSFNYPTNLKLCLNKYFKCNQNKASDKDDSQKYKNLFDKNNTLYKEIAKKNIDWFNEKMEFEKKLYAENSKLKQSHKIQYEIVPKNYKLRYGSFFNNSSSSFCDFVSMTGIFAFISFIIYLTK
jgi:hypothetical protein